MSCNNFQPHLHIYTEDDATHDAADGFMQSFPERKQRQIQIFPCGSGYSSVKAKMLADAKLSAFPQRMIACIIDFDNQPNRQEELRACVASDMRGHIYVIGCADEIESAKQTLGFRGTNDAFGERLAVLDCEEWNSPCLKPSVSELQRLLNDLRSRGICP